MILWSSLTGIVSSWFATRLRHKSQMTFQSRQILENRFYGVPRFRSLFFFYHSLLSSLTAFTQFYLNVLHVGICCPICTLEDNCVSIFVDTLVCQIHARFSRGLIFLYVLHFWQSNRDQFSSDWLVAWSTNWCHCSLARVYDNSDFYKKGSFPYFKKRKG